MTSPILCFLGVSSSTYEKCHVFRKCGSSYDGISSLKIAYTFNFLPVQYRRSYLPLEVL